MTVTPPDALVCNAMHIRSNFCTLQSLHAWGDRQDEDDARGLSLFVTHKRHLQSCNPSTLPLVSVHACGNSILEHVSPLSPKYVPTQPDISPRRMRARDANMPNLCPLSHLLCRRRCPSPSRASGSAWWPPTTTSSASLPRRGPSPSPGGSPSGRRRPPQPPSLAP